MNQAIRTIEYDQPLTQGMTCGVGHAWAKVPDMPSAEEKRVLKARIRNLLKREKAVLVAHYYVDAELQELADETGGCVADSLEMRASAAITMRRRWWSRVCGLWARPRRF